MRAMLLAAGVGTRLRPLTERIPKAMVEVEGMPVLEHHLRWLREYGITDIAVNLHHLPDVPRRYFGDGSALGVRIHWSFEPELLGTAGALLPVFDFLAGSRFFVVYADNLIACDLDSLVATHEQLAATVTIALWERENVSASGVAELDERSRIRRFNEKPASGQTASRLVSAGLLLCEPEVLASIGAPPTDIGLDLLPSLIAAGAVVAGYRMGAHERLRWIDTPEDLARIATGTCEHGSRS